MEKETMGTAISVTKQWWLKVNRKPARVHAMKLHRYARYPGFPAVLTTNGFTGKKVPQKKKIPSCWKRSSVCTAK